MKLIFAQRLGPWLARNPGILHAVWRLEALLVRGLIALFRALGPERSATVGAWLLARFGPRARKKQPVVAATLRRVTPQLSEAERAKVARLLEYAQEMEKECDAPFDPTAAGLLRSCTQALEKVNGRALMKI